MVNHLGELGCNLVAELKLTTQFKMGAVQSLQGWLEYDGCRGVNFSGNSGLGKIGTTGFLLGAVYGGHVALVAVSLLLDVGEWNALILQWSVYMSLLCLFHFMEFFTTAVRQPASLGYSSFVVNHSLSYTIAALLSWLEFWLESFVFRGRKSNATCMLVGLIFVIGGQGIRTLAMWSCGEHFDHQIMERRRDDHKLVKRGIYSVLRHPSYFGWFYWSIGTQLLLCNPLCTVAYALASWHFFSGRIPFEEETLLSFYRQEYVDYMKTTWIGIPFIKSQVPSS